VMMRGTAKTAIFQDLCQSAKILATAIE